jgi:fucose permease
MGLTGGIWNARIPAAKSQVHLSDGALGLALFAVPVGLLLGAALAERLVDRVGSAVLVRICGVGACAAAVTPGLAHTLPELMAGLFLVGVFGGTLDVSANAQGVRVEAAYGRPVMTSMHAFFSLGAILGSLAGGAFAALGVGLLPSLAVVGAAGAAIDGTAGRWLLSDAGHRRRDPAAAPAPDELTMPDALTAPPAPASPGPASPSRRQVRRLVLALGVLGICGLVGEGAAGDWSAVYLRDNLGTSAAVAALGFAAFSVTMTIGRGLGDWLIQRFGVVAVIRACGVVATAGLALALVTSVPAIAIAGFTAFGAGLSIVVPQVFAAGGRADPDRPGSGLARVVGLGYTGMTAGPAVIGLVADQTGLHLALVIPLVLAAWIAVGARVLRVSLGITRIPIAHRSADGIP